MSHCFLCDSKIKQKNLIKIVYRYTEDGVQKENSVTLCENCEKSIEWAEINDK